MRLSAAEKREIPRVFAEVLKEVQYKLFLFGSRTDSNKKGGDIDLLVLVDKVHKDFCIQKKAAIKFELMNAIGEQKIDITIATKEEMQNDPFLKSIANSLLEFTASSNTQ